MLTAYTRLPLVTSAALCLRAVENVLSHEIIEPKYLMSVVVGTGVAFLNLTFGLSAPAGTRISVLVFIP